MYVVIVEGFYDDDKLVNYFMQIHECKQQKRLNQTESARGKRVHLVGTAARAVLTPKVGNGLTDELKRAGLWVRTVSDKLQATDVLLRNHTVDIMHKRTECLVVVSKFSKLNLAEF
ncbi:hypothetical protein CICLE_v10030369mg [Citrus x clementina]|uniref:Uncharacterized protein n=1 Tax=Citrus clementina TaxID=85681 RepID=V4SIB8_CITCL|nr:hypothetical protein CICLE_v10030369mg [Citrus x clementina]